jgi:hypothetical protein
VVENVRGAQKWVGRSRWNFGSFHLWGDVPALMPMTKRVQKFNPDGTAHPPGSWFAIADSKNRGSKSIPHRPVGHWTNPQENRAQPVPDQNKTSPQAGDGIKQGGIAGMRNNGKGDRWFQDGAAQASVTGEAGSRAPIREAS